MPSLFSADLLSPLLAAAIRLSGLHPIAVDQLPPLIPLTEVELANEACPGEEGACRSIAALFDTERYRILMRSTLDPADPMENSFLVHEFVHVLQYHQYGVAYFDSCMNRLRSEHDAYAVQNAYLRTQGIFWREGESLRFMHCPPGEK